MIPPCLFLGITLDIKETRNAITCDVSIFGAETRDKKEAKFSITLDFLDKSNMSLLPSHHIIILYNALELVLRCTYIWESICGNDSYNSG